MKKYNKKKSPFFTILLLVSFMIFASSQLIVNSILTPLGTQLQSLNTEKEFLLEENRKISEEIAKSSSIRVIEKLSEKKLSLSQDKVQTFIYVEDTTLVASY
jgi:predicted PurR-regulated permease PerM